MSTLSIELTDELTQLVEQSMDAGGYDTTEDVIRASLLAFKQLNQDDAAKFDQLKVEIDKGFASGIAEGTVDEIFASVKTRVRARLAARAMAS